MRTLRHVDVLEQALGSVCCTILGQGTAPDAVVRGAVVVWAGSCIYLP